MPTINPISTGTPGFNQYPRRRFAAISIAATLVITLTWVVACAAFAVEDEFDYEAKVCDRVESISDGMLREELSVEEIEEQIALLEAELESVRGELVDSTERFVFALKDLLAGGYYDYPTLQVLNYLDTYEHMEQHVESHESFENVRFECGNIGKEWIGDAPAVEIHFSQSGIEDGKYTLQELIEHGELLFTASFNTLDGAGRPTRTGVGDFRDRREGVESFNRISGPDANACSGCHNTPVIGGGGDNVANVFVLGQRFEFVDFDDQKEFDFRSELDDRLQYEQEDEDPLTLQNVGNERNTVGMFGAGFVELLAREMTRELLAQEEAIIAEARESGWPVRRDISAKGVDFGSITAHPNGFVYTSEVEGVDGRSNRQAVQPKGCVQEPARIQQRRHVAPSWHRKLRKGRLLHRPRR